MGKYSAQNWDGAADIRRRSLALKAVERNIRIVAEGWGIPPDSFCKAGLHPGWSTESSDWAAEIAPQSVESANSSLFDPSDSLLYL